MLQALVASHASGSQNSLGHCRCHVWKAQIAARARARARAWILTRTLRASELMGSPAPIAALLGHAELIAKMEKRGRRVPDIFGWQRQRH